MRDTIASLIGVDDITIPQVTVQMASVGWMILCTVARFGWAGALWLGGTVENNSHRVHEWASTGRHARGNINGNAENMIRHARNTLHPADKIAMVASIVFAAVSPPYGFLLPVATYVVFFHNADELKASSTILGYLGMGVSAVLNVMLIAASFITSNRWRKEQFR
ncbi:hypothetical protein [Haloplanus sp. C73]|uniref:hypothetical protein n=1 Tax=Haloplanus sp. C73 TaxID=3421641 RepID=UPI003EBF45C3